MLLFFDMEFTRLSQDTMPISLGIISEDGRQFYAEFTDFNERECDQWVKSEVLENLYTYNKNVYDAPYIENFHVGAISDIRKALIIWLNQFDDIQFVSDVCHYDFVLLITILTNGGTALCLPKKISAVCHDINQDIARHFIISDAEAFDMRREEIMDGMCNPDDVVTGNKHNSLYDAKVIRAIYHEITQS